MKTLSYEQVRLHIFSTFYCCRYFRRGISAIILLLFMFTPGRAQVYYPGGLSNSNLSLWLDAADAASLTLVYNSTGTTGNGSSGSNTLTSAATIAVTTPVGSVLRLGSDLTRTYTVTGISGTTIVVTPSLATSYSNSVIYRAAVSLWKDKSGGNRNATQATAASQPSYLSNIQGGLPALGFPTTVSLMTGPTGNYQTVGAERLIRTGGGYHTLFAVPANVDFSIRNSGGTNNYGDAAPFNGDDWAFGASPSPALWVNATNTVAYTPAVFHVLTTYSAAARTGTYSISTSNFSTRGMTGNDAVGEIVSWGNLLSVTNRQLLEGYLGWKWGNTLSAGPYISAGTSGFKNGLVGIGRVSLSDSIAGTRSNNGLGFEAGTGFLQNNGDYLTAVDNNATGMSVVNSISRFNRTWRITKTDVNSNGGNVTLFFDYQMLAGNTTPSSNTGNYQLIYNATNSSFPSSGTTTIQSSATIVTGSLVKFTVNASTLANGFYTLKTCYTSSPFSYAGSPYCVNAGSATITLESGATAGTFTALPSGLSLNTSTGTINLNASAAGTYTVTNTVTGIGGCTSVSSEDITILPAPSATISYTGGPYCSTAGPVNVTFTGTPGGTYSAPPGLSLNASTGTVNPAASAIGTYTVTYTVAAAGGCSAYATTTNVIIQAPPSLRGISALNLIADYKFSGNANDATGNNTGTLQNGPEPVADRFNIAASAFAFNGSTQYVSTANAYQNPTEFTISAWFKTTTVTGGDILSFGTSQTGLSSQHDRHLYMNNEGKIYFGIYNGTVATVNSALSYNDGNWHLVTATLSATQGMVLYMDGVAVGTNGITQPENYTGYWRVGFDNLSGWTSQPASFYFNGIIDDALIYHRVISPVEAALFYTSPDGAGNNGPVCSGAQLNLTATALTGATYLWTGPNGFSSTARNPASTYNILNAGIYKVEVTVSGCTSIAYTNVVSSGNAGQWVGNISNDWNNAGNWCDGVVPSSSTDVIIPAGAARMPVISGTATCNNLAINTGATLTTALGGSLNVAGKITNSGTMTNRGTTAFVGSTGQQTFTGVSTFFNLIVNNPGGLLLPAQITVGNDLTIATGTLNANNFRIYVAGNWTNNVSTTAFVAGNSTVAFNNTAPQTIGGTASTTFNNLFVSDSGTVLTLAKDVLITGYLTVSIGTLDLGAFTANRSVAGNILTVSNGATLKIGGTNAFPLNYSSTSLAIASTVEYSGTNQAIAARAYGNLTLSSSAGAAVKTMSTTALVIAGNLNLVKGSGTSVSFTAAASITVSGSMSIAASTTFDGGSYVHNFGGNWVNEGTFAGNTSTVNFNGIYSSVRGAGAQNFHHLTVTAEGVSFSANTIQLNGNLATTGAGAFTQAAGGNLLMTGSGTTISGGNISLENLSVTGTVSTSSSLTLTGNLAVSGSFTAANGTIIMAGATKTISGAGTMTFDILSVTGTAVSSAGFTIGSALTVSGALSASAGTAVFTGTSTLSGTANLFNVNQNGTSLTLLAGAQLGIAGVLTLSAGLIDVLSSIPNTVNFNGAGAQVINAISYDNLLISNSGTKTAAGGITVNRNITLGSGTTFMPGAFTHTVFGDWINNSGTFSAGAGTIRFSGATTSNITGTSTFNILTLEKNTFVTTVILKSNVTASIVNMTLGNLATGANTITITDTRNGAGIIMGNIQRTHLFTNGVAYAFEGPDNTILFSTVTGVSSITVSVNEGSVNDFPFGGSVNRLYNISVPSGTYNATLRLHYNDAEINGNDESSMALWQFNGSTWMAVGKTANNTTSNYVEQTGLSNITNRWTLSDDGNVVQWNGSVSSDWNTPANWTVLQGSGSRPPSSTDIVNIGTVTFNNQPTISTSVSVKNITFGSSKAVTLSMATGGSLVTGNINGDWTTSFTHTIQVQNQAVTINGDFALSDGTTGHAINLNIGSGSVTIAGSLNQLGGAAVNITGTGTINIGGNFNYTNGLFTAGGGTVNFNGPATQVVGIVTYNNLVVNKPAGQMAWINNALTVKGNLTVSTGQLENMSDLTVSGNFTIATGATMINNGTIHVAGNWLKNGTFIPSGSGVFFEGTADQTISASNFGDLVINKPSGTATLTGALTLTGNVNLLSGSFDLQTFNATRTATGGTMTIANGSTILIGGNNGPINFTTIDLGASSTAIYNGTGAQSVNSTGISFGHVVFRNGGTNAKTLATSATVRGDLSIENGATLNGATYTITLSGNWLNNGSFIPSTGSVVFGGQSKTITGNTTFYRATITGKYVVMSDLTYNKLLSITSTGSISSGSGILSTVHGDLTNSGILNTAGTATFTGNVLQTISLLNAAATYVQTVNFNGTVSPVLNSTSSPQYLNLNINNTGGVYPSISWTILNALSIGPGAAFIGGTYTHTVNGNLLNNGKFTSGGTLNFIPSLAATLNMGSDFTSTGTVSFGGTGAITLAGTPLSFNSVNVTNTNVAGITPSSNWNLNGSLLVNPTSVFHAAAYSYNIGGNINFRGVMNQGTSSITLKGTGAQEISSGSIFNNLILNKPSGAAVLLTNIRVGGTLDFLAGKVQTGISTLTMEAGAVLSGASQSSGWVNGNLRKDVAAGSGTQNFEVGDVAYYAPAAITFSNVTTAGTLLVKTTPAEHPDILNSNINPSRSVNRYWSFTNAGIVFTSYTGTFNFVTSDIDAGATPSAFKTALNNGSSWRWPVTASAGATSIQSVGVTTFGDFAIGEVCNAGTAISYAGTPYCASGSLANPVIAGTTGGTFSSSAGLSLNPASGEVNLQTSLPGTYNITYTISASSECPVFITSTSLTITAAPLATISYAGTPFCASAGTKSVTLSGSPGGKFTSGAGLSLNDSTGSINLGTSAPGSYTVSYTFAASGGCNIYSTTTNITVVPTPPAPGVVSPVIYCQDAVPVPLTASGTNLFWGNGAITGSVGSATPFTSPVYTDNSFNNKKTLFRTNAPNVLVSTLDFYVPAYQAVYGIVLAIYDGAGTVVATSLAPVSQNAGATALKVSSTFNFNLVSQGDYSIGIYSGNGDMGYISPAFPINEASGNIQITGVSSPGVMCFSNINFTVDNGSSAPLPITRIIGTFNFVVRQIVNGCASPQANIAVIVNAKPSAAISYPDTLLCKSAGIQTVARTGSGGGRYTSTAGLSIDSVSGSITPASSLAGAYTVTYTIPASEGCEIFSTTARVEITAVPSATLSYGVSSYCTASGTAVAALAGSLGGIFTAPAGAAINAVTGEINLYRSTPGVYTISYTVAASGGCSLFTTTAGITITASPAISLVPAGNLVAVYKFEGNANDVTGNNNGSLQNNPAPATDRFNNANKAYSFNGTNQYISTTNLYVNPTDFTVSLWFKTTTTTGGKLIGFGVSQTGQSGQFDRHVYMSNSGQIYFGVYNGGIKIITTASSYNDGNWHQVSASLSATNGMVLYMDGALAGSNPAKLAESFTGYWKIGYENLAGWPSQPSSFYFSGLLDDAIIYHRALSAAEVGLMFNSPDGAGSNGPVCLGSALNLTAPFVSGATYSWTGPNGFSSTLQNPVLPFAAENAGTYTVRVTASGCTTTAYTNVTASTNPGQWTGNVSTDWNNAANWCNGVIPVASTNVVINAGAARMPLINAAAFCNNILINAGATLAITGSNTLTVSGNFENNGGTFSPATGTVIFSASTGTQLLNTGGSAFYNILHSGAGTLQPLASNLVTGGYFINEATAGDVDFVTNGIQHTSAGPLTLAGGNYRSGAGAKNFNGGLNLSGGIFTGNGGAVTVTDVNLNAGTMVAPSGAFNVKGSWINNGGTFTTGLNTVTFSGNTPQLIGGSASTLFHHFTANNASGIMSGNITINGVLNLQSTNPSATAGSLDMGTNTLNMGPVATTSGEGDVTGIVRRTTLLPNIAYSFGNPYTTATFQERGDIPEELSYRIQIGTAPIWKADGISRIYDIFYKRGIGFYGTAKFHYLDSELNGNTENQLVFFRYLYKESYLFENGRSNFNTTDNWIELSNLSGTVQDSANVGELEWTLGNQLTINKVWSGTTNTDWFNTLNWTGGVPGPLDNVVIPDAATTNFDPLLPDSTTINSIRIDSAAILNGGSGKLYLAGGDGAWLDNGVFNYGTSTVSFTNASATMAGTSEFYNITIQTDAALTMGDGQLIRIFGTMTNNGTWNVGFNDNTVHYAGGDQVIINPNGAAGGYSTLLLGGTGIKTMPVTAMNIRGDFIIKDMLDVTARSALEIDGMFKLEPTTIFNAGGFDHSLMGDWDNSGTFMPGSNTMVFNGESIQNIIGSSATSFNNLTVAGAGVLLASDALINNTLTLNTGTFNLGPHTLSMSATANPIAGSPFSASNMIIADGGGEIRKAATGAVQAGYFFPVGDNTTPAGYSPVTLDFTGGTYAGYAGIKVFAIKHPSNADTASYLNRYWTIFQSGYTGFEATVTAVYVDAGDSNDVFGNESDLAMGQWAGAVPWNLFVSSIDTVNNTLTASGLTSFGDFSGIDTMPPAQLIITALPGSTICVNTPLTLTVEAGGETGLTYLWSNGLGTSKTVTAPSSVPGTTTYSVTVTDGNGFATSSGITILVNPLPVVAVADTASDLCYSSSVQSVLLEYTDSTNTLTTYSISWDSAAIAAGMLYVSNQVLSGSPIIINVPAGMLTGLYTGSVVAGNAGGCNTIANTFTFRITPLPQITWRSTTLSVCASALEQPVPLYYTSQGDALATYSVVWDADAAAMAAGFENVIGESPNDSLFMLRVPADAPPGVYTGIVTGFNANGCGGPAETFTITVNARPDVTGVSITAIPVCSGENAGILVNGNLADGDYTIYYHLSGANTATSVPAGLSISAGKGSFIIPPLLNEGSTVVTLAAITGTGSCNSGFVNGDTTTLLVNIPGTWLGATNTDWFLNANWCGGVPSAITNVLIRGNRLHYPVINSGTAAINSILIEAGASLAVDNATLKISGSISNLGSLAAANGNIELNGTTAQFIPASTFAGNTIKSLSINNTSGVTLGGIVNLTDVLTIHSGVVNTGGFLVLKSSATATARVAPISSIATVPVNGAVTVERYIPGRRKYRLITSSVTTSTSPVLNPGEEASSIWGNWQNSGDNISAHSGNFITGGTAAHGFDTQTGNASLFTYNDVSRNFSGFSSANGKNTKFTPLVAGFAYYMFVYGDRRNTISTSTPDFTILRAKGTLLTGDQAYHAGSASPLSNVIGRYTLVGNPFASPFNWASVVKTDISNTYWGWDPNLSSTGGYITVNTAGTVTLISPFSGTTGLNQFIQPGQGFFVKTTGASPALTIREQDKVATFNANAFRTSSTTGANDLPLIAINLLYTSAGGTVLADGTLAAFDPLFSAGIGEEDAVKISNSGEGIAIANSGELFSIDARPLPKDGDMIQLNTARLTRTAYTLQIFANKMQAVNVQAYLEDAFLHSIQPLSLNDTNLVTFAINRSEDASFVLNRFRIIFRTLSVLPVRYLSVGAEKQLKNINVKWQVAEENGISSYEVERSDNGIDFKKAGSIPATPVNGSGMYNWTDQKILEKDNYYRILALEKDGKRYYSKIVVVKKSKSRPQIKVYPNPVLNQQIQLMFIDMDRGEYTVSVHNTRGQQLLDLQVDHPGGTSKHLVPLVQHLPPGMYYLHIRGENRRHRLDFLIE